MTQKARLMWHCRRGMRELDLLLEAFLAERFDALPPAEREAFARLLDCPNEDLMDWLMEGREPRDAQLARMVRKVREGIRPGA